MFSVTVYYKNNAQHTCKYTAYAPDAICIHSAIALYDNLCSKEQEAFVQLHHNCNGKATLLASSGDPV